MRKTTLLFSSLLLLFLISCGGKPADANTSAAKSAQPATATNQTAKTETETPQSKIAEGEHAMAVTVNPLATKAALDAIKKGGNAIDGAVAAALTLGVVDGHNSGIGGGCFMLIRRSNGAYIAIDGREMAPGKASRDMYLRDGKADPELSQHGALAAATPGALAAYDLAVRKFGKLPMKELLLPAAKIAEEGFPVDPHYAKVTKNVADELRKFPESSAIFLKNGQPLEPGDILKQADLSKTYRAIAEQGVGWFYNGPFAEAAETWMKQNGGLLAASDFKNYQAVFREPIFTDYRGYTIATMPPPSSGGVHVIQILNICETQDLHQMRRKAADVIHYVAEAMKLAFADRAYWLGDPDYVKVPKNLISKTYCRELASKIKMDKVIDVPSHGTPSKADEEFFKSLLGKHTTHFSVADEEGNWVACTATVNTSFGSKVVVPGTGVVLNNQMDDFAAQPGVPNFFGLVGTEANAVAPFKRPLSSMSPTIISKDGKAVMAVGAAGGPTIITQVAQTIINYLDMGMRGGPEMEQFELSIYDALRTPRFHHQWVPDELRIEKKWTDEVIAGLKEKGHKIKQVDSFGACQVIATKPEGKGFIGCADPRGYGKAEGF